MPSIDIFCDEVRFVHLEEEWRLGLGWSLVDGKVRSRVTVSAAMRLVRHGLALEVLLEAQELLRRLETSTENPLPAEESQAAVNDFRSELAVACAEHRDDPETSLLRVPMVAALTSQQANWGFAHHPFGAGSAPYKALERKPTALPDGGEIARSRHDSGH